MTEIIELHDEYVKCEICDTVIPKNSICPECELREIFQGRKGEDDNEYKMPKV